MTVVVRPVSKVGKEGTFMDGIRREIAIMKKVNHPNVLRLYEVMDDPKVLRCKKHEMGVYVRRVVGRQMSEKEAFWIGGRGFERGYRCEMIERGRYYTVP